MLAGEAGRFRWEGQSILAFTYLIVAGSCLGYASYIWLLHHVPAARAATFTCVNPVVAVLLGWLILGEPIGPSIVLGTLIIIPAVILAVSGPRRG